MSYMDNEKIGVFKKIKDMTLAEQKAEVWYSMWEPMLPMRPNRPTKYYKMEPEHRAKPNLAYLLRCDFYRRLREQRKKGSTYDLDRKDLADVKPWEPVGAAESRILKKPKRKMGQDEGNFAKDRKTRRGSQKKIDFESQDSKVDSKDVKASQDPKTGSNDTEPKTSPEATEAVGFFKWPKWGAEDKKAESEDVKADSKDVKADSKEIKASQDVNTVSKDTKTASQDTKTVSKDMAPDSTTAAPENSPKLTEAEAEAAGALKGGFFKWPNWGEVSSDEDSDDESSSSSEDIVAKVSKSSPVTNASKVTDIASNVKGSSSQDYQTTTEIRRRKSCSCKNNNENTKEEMPPLPQGKKHRPYPKFL